MTQWITSDPAIAAQLRDVDRQYDAARKAAAQLPLAQKVEALRAAKAARADAYHAIYEAKK